METIQSFTVDHLTLVPGLYISRKDKYGADTVITTFDLRFTAPNREPVLDVSAVHTIEHMGATYLRNSSMKDRVVYFGPMGCRTGFYLVMYGDLSPEDIRGLLIDMCDYILAFSGEVPGARPEMCGNYSEHNLSMAQLYIRKYRVVLSEG